MKRDMPRTFIEPHRPSHKGKYPRGTKKLRQCDDEGELYSPPTGMKRTHAYANKFDSGYIGTNFGALRRFLRSRVGQDWNDVFSEICEQADARSFRGHHLREWLEFTVDVKTRMEGGKIVDQQGSDITVTFHRDNFYVHPLTNKLERSEPRKREKWSESVPKSVFEVEGQFFHEHDGIWYRVLMEEAKKTPSRWGYLTYSTSYPDKLIKFPPEYNYNYWSVERLLRNKYGYSPSGKVWYCIHKESANSKEIARLKKNLQQKNVA